MAIEKTGLRIDTEVKGEQQLDALVKDMEDLDRVAIRFSSDLRQAISALQKGTNLSGVSNNFKTLKEEVSRTSGALKQNQAASTAAAQGLKATEDATKRARKGFGDLSSILSTLTATLGASNFVGTTATIDGINKSLVQLTRTEEEAAIQGNKIREVTERLGLELLSTSRAYVSLLAASKGTVLEGENTEKIFTSVAGSLSLLGKSAFEVEGALKAVEQIISKGKVQAEELRGQLGERLPGAFQIAAKAMNLTTAELSKQLELGNVYADEFLPKFAKQLDETFRLDQVDRIDTLSAALNRLKNTSTEVAASFERAGGATFLSGAADSAGLVVKLLQQTAASAGAGAASIVDSFKDVGEAIINQDLASLPGKLAENYNLAAGVIEDSANTIFDAGGKIDAANALVTAKVGGIASGFKVTAAESEKFAEDITLAFRALNLDDVVSKVSTAETKFLDAFGTISERSEKTREAFEKLNETFSQAASAQGIDAIALALESVFSQGRATSEVIGALRDKLEKIEPGDKVEAITKSFESLVESSAKSGESIDLINKALESLNPGQTNNVEEALKGIDKAGVSSEQVLLALQVALDGVKTPDAVLQLGRDLQEAGLSGEGLRKGLELVRSRLADVEAEAENFRAGITRASEALQSLGVQSSAGIVEGFERAARTLDELRATGVATSRDIQRAFFASTEEILKKFGDLDEGQRNTVVNLVKSQAAAAGLSDQLSAAALQAAAATGNTSELSRELERASDNAFNTANSVEAAFAGLGIRSSQEIVRGFDAAIRQLDKLKSSGQVTANDLQRAFFAATEGISQSFSDLSVEQRKSVVNIIESQAAAVGLKGKFDEAALAAAAISGNTESLIRQLQAAEEKALGTSKSIFGLKAAFDGSLDSVKQVSEALFNNDKQIRESTSAVRQQKEATEELEGATEGAISGWEDLTAAQRDSIRSASDAAAATGFVNSILDSISTRLGAISEASVEAFENRLSGGALSAEASVKTLQQRIEETDAEILRLGALESSGATGVFTKIAAFYSRIADEVELSALRQLAALNDLASKAESGSSLALNQLTVTGDELETLKRRFDLVDESTFDQVIAQVRALKGELEGAADRTEQLRERLESLRAKSDVERQQLDNQRALSDIQKQIAKAQRDDNRLLENELREQLKIQKEINEEELKRVKGSNDEAEARRRSNRQDSDQQRPSAGGANAPGSGRSNVVPLSGGGTTTTQNIVVIPLPDRFAEEFVRRGITEGIVRSVISPALRRNEKLSS